MRRSAHYHHRGFGRLELLRVDDPVRGRMTPVGEGPKQGFCTGDVKIAEWSAFGGDQNSADSTCVESAGLVYDPTRGTRMGLSPGWADLYSWEQDGNYGRTPMPWAFSSAISSRSRNDK